MSPELLRFIDAVIVLVDAGLCLAGPTKDRKVVRELTLAPELYRELLSALHQTPYFDYVQAWQNPKSEPEVFLYGVRILQARA